MIKDSSLTEVILRTIYTRPNDRICAMRSISTAQCSDVKEAAIGVGVCPNCSWKGGRLLEDGKGRPSTIEKPQPKPLRCHLNKTSINNMSTSSSYARSARLLPASRPSTSDQTSYTQHTSYEYSNRPRTAISTIGLESGQIICAISESRGIAPTVGLAFVNLETGEAVLSQIPDSQSYVRTLHKLAVFSPSQILIVDTALKPKSKLFSIIEENLDDLNSNLVLLNRRYWAETTGIEYIEQFAFTDDVEAIKMSVNGNYFSVCCFAAVCIVTDNSLQWRSTHILQVLKFIELAMSKTFPVHSLRIKYEASEGSMMIDLSTIRSLELIQNLQNQKSADCLFGVLNETLTPMGSRLLRSNILQPLTDDQTLGTRYDALEELSSKEEMFFATRAALKTMLDADKILTQLIIIPTNPTLQLTEQNINNIIMLKQFIGAIQPIHEALAGARSVMLKEIKHVGIPNSQKETTFANRTKELRPSKCQSNKGTNRRIYQPRHYIREAASRITQPKNIRSQGKICSEDITNCTNRLISRE